MSLFIEKLKVSNFLSFFGESEVNLKPLTAVMCNYDEGKSDFFKAVEFVFGADANENPLNLVHKVLREEFQKSRDVKCYVEATINLMQENKQLTFCRSVEFGIGQTWIRHKISGIITTRLVYEENLNSLNLNVKRKNLIFYKSYFNNCVWGSSEDLEMTIITCLRDDCLMDLWKRARKEVECWKNLKKRASQCNPDPIKRTYDIVEKLATDFEMILAKKETIKQDGIKSMKNLEDAGDGHSVEEATEEEEEDEEEKIKTFEIKSKMKMTKINDLESKCESLTEKSNELKLKSAILTSRLHQSEINLAIKSGNFSILENRTMELKNEIREKTNKLMETMKNIEELNAEVENISDKISSNLLFRKELQRTANLQNRFTAYGRFVDYLCPSGHCRLLQKIIGDELFYANICDSMEEALSAMNLMKRLNYEQRETFIILDNYSHHLKNTLTASGEMGVEIKNYEQLLTFLSKLAHYGLIDEVPIIVKKKFEYDYEMPPTNAYVIYDEDDLHFASNGSICFHKFDGEIFCAENEEELEEDFIRLKFEEEIKYQQLNDEFFHRFEFLSDANQIENDLFYLEGKKSKINRSIHRETKEVFSRPKIYDEYVEIFTQCEEEWKKQEKLMESPEDFISRLIPREETISVWQCEDAINSMSMELTELVEEKNRAQKQLEASKTRLRNLRVMPIYNYKFKKFSIRFDNLDASILFFEKKFKKLKKLIINNNLEEFMGCQEWKKFSTLLLCRQSKEMKKKLRESKEAFQSVSHARKNQLNPLIEHCSHFLSRTFHLLLDKALPNIHLHLSSNEENLQIISSFEKDQNNFVDIRNFNTFIKFTSILSLFLELAKFDQVPLMIFEDIEDFFPHPIDNLEAVLDQSTIKNIVPENENLRFHLLMRIGQFFLHYLKQTNFGDQKGNLKDTTCGPMQIIFFSKEDLILSAQHCIWIQSQGLPSRFIREDCDSYSLIHEIKFKM